MKKAIFTLASLVCLFLNTTTQGQGNVTVDVFNGAVQIDGDNYSNSIDIRSTRGGWIVEGFDGTTVNGQQNAIVTASSSLSIDLKNGNDVLSLANLGTNELEIRNGWGNCELSLYNLRFVDAIIMTEQGHDDVQVSGCAGRFLRVGDGGGMFLLNAVVAGAYSSASIENCTIECVDVQCYDLYVLGLEGALRGSATEAMVQDVDSTTGNANLYFPLVEVSPSTVWLSCEANSRETDFYVRNIVCDHFGIVTTGTLLNQRFSEDDRLLVVNVEAEEVFEIGTGKGRDWVLTSTVRTDNFWISLGEERDDKNYGYFYNTFADGKSFVKSGDRDDRIRLSGCVFNNDIDVETGDGNDRVEIISASMMDRVTIELSGGNDVVEIGRSYLSNLYVDGGRHFDQVNKDVMTWLGIYDLDNVESDNL